ncbi:hypothetical protein K504DRAFT_96146 [Pleomassaria siparia CBS 279.74]|uniref:Uncharacterized protein n=1 Tax=Pleomassaria siparia CBS 279.74 TaxID=1314801 RepID=A0A6G1JY07_9PLEO|nr:hypothetical protein K504DRAFT_96146 [Pleomassaria siparia CBS 279.74]
MTGDIRKNALRQIDEKAPPHAWNPDSLTGITESVLYEEAQVSFNETRVSSSAAAISVALDLPSNSFGSDRRTTSLSLRYSIANDYKEGDAIPPPL